MKTICEKLASCFGGIAVAALTLNAVAEPISYNRDIRPILSDKCFSCHGPDNHDRKADLRLDVTEEGESEGVKFFGAYFAIEPDDPEMSDLVDRIHSTKASTVMPPPESKMTLSDDEKALLVRWIKEGAKYEKHWSFEPIKKPAVPKVQDKAWPSSAIDRFVLARLEQEGLEPSPQAPKATLLRRLSLDLIGLPPTPEELDAFLKDSSADAYEKQVDRLMASPHYGERMALPWLDAARYADTNGFSIDDHRDMWLWREWVIDALNKNMPYDRFLTEQLAGDLLPDATDTQKLATGFLRNSMNTHEGGTIPAEYRVIYIADKIDTVSTVFMGLTMRCAQCHDHKYDPLSQNEYYQMYAFFDTADEPGMGAHNGNTDPVIRTTGPITGKEAWRQDSEARIATLKRYLVHPPELVVPRARWEAEVAASAKGELAAALNTPAEQREAAQWQTINSAYARAEPKWNQHQSGIKAEIAVLQKDLKQGLPSVMVMKEQGPRQTHVLTRGEYDKPDKSQPVGPGVPGVLPPLTTDREDRQHGDKKQQASQADPWQQARWVWDNPGAAKGEQDNAPRYFRLVFDLDKQPDRAVLHATADNSCTSFVNGKKLGSNDPWMTPARYDVAEHLTKGRNVIAIKAVNAGGATGLLAALVIDGKPVHATGEAWRVSTSGKGNWTAPRFDDSQWAQAAELGPASMAPWKIGPSNAQPDPDQPTRLDLARWLVRPDHPLTARVAVNRVWQTLMSRGLVATPNDLGSQGDYPSHPELLDWLATDYREQGWDTKRLVKQIVMSSTYRQSSNTTPQLLERDPANALIARMSRVRLPAELIRDNALAIAGKLDSRIGGPSAYPAQPFGLWREVSHFGYTGKAFTAQAFYPSTGDDLARRSMYTFWKRTSPPPSLSAFDAPSREVCVVQRSRTNTPLQSLVLLNDPEYFNAARALASMAMDKAGDQPADAIAYMFRRATARHPDGQESQILLRHYRNALQHFTDNKDAAQAVAGDNNPALAATTVVASTILNLDQTITRE